MDGAFLGLVLGLGLASIWWSFWPREARPPVRTRRRWLDRLADEIVLAGIRGLGPGGLLASSAVLGLLVLGLGYAVTSVLPVSACFAVMGACAPTV